MILILILAVIFGVRELLLIDQRKNAQNIPSDLTEGNNKKTSDGNSVMSKQRYKEMIENETGKKIIYSESDDFDFDGNYEMFAIVEADSKEKINDNNYYGTIWYINNSGSPVLIEDSMMEYKKDPYTIAVDENVFIVFVSEQADEDIAYIWGVDNGEPFQPVISGKGSDVKKNEFNELEITHTTYERVYSLALIPLDEENNVFLPPSISYTEEEANKNYYFYFDGNAFKEYGGMEIDIDDVLKFPQGKEIINRIHNHSYNIDSIYYRDNGIMNINISQALIERVGDDHTNDYTNEYTNYYNITLRYIDGKWKPILPHKMNEKCGNGVYLDALIPAIATYPNEYLN